MIDQHRDRLQQSWHERRRDMGFDFGNERLNEPKAAFCNTLHFARSEPGGGSER
jgi:hypothetical protein